MLGRSAPAIIRRDLNARVKRALARRLPWPYNGMVSDVTSAVQTCCNYLAASGLVCYTEVCGRQLFFGGDRRVKNHKCYAKFVEYMDAADALSLPLSFQRQTMTFYDAVRSGLVHHYFMKADGGGIALTTSSPEGRRLGVFIKPNGGLWFAVVPYFNLFAAALDRAHQDGRMAAGWKR
jgi:hypothetical protein